MNRSSRRCISSLLVAASATLTLDAQAVTHRYTEARGSVSTSIVIAVTPDAGGFEVSSSGSGSTDTIRWMPGVGTVDWRTVNAGEGSDLHAVRSGDMIHVTGTRKGRTLNRDLTVDAAPWYQLFGPLLDQLLPAGSGAQEFWVLDPSNFSPHKMQVRRAGTERITVQGTALEALKIHFSPAGALAPFWGADFWYRQSDRAYVRSRLPENGGLTVTTIEDAVP